MFRVALALITSQNAIGLRIPDGPEDKAQSVSFLPDVDDLERDRLSLDVFGGDGYYAKHGLTTCGLKDAHLFTDNDCSIFQSDRACNSARAKVTYLDTYPCVGNTWTRVMLEVVTRIRTGSVFDDGSLKSAGLAGEGVRDPSKVVAVKSHAPIFGNEPKNPGAPNGQYRAIVIHRRPLDAALSWASYQMGDHAEEVPYEKLREYFKRNAKTFLKQWANFYSMWKSQDDVLVLKYEDIVADTRGTYLNHILPFLGVNSKDPDILRRLDCAIACANQNGKTHRNHTYAYKFDSQDRALAYKYAGAVAHSLGYVVG
jgi:hypothetical protein